MRGKKVDAIFIGNFIAECVLQGKTLQDDIVEEARRKIEVIDEKIKETEKMKVTRSKLVDIITTLENKKRSSSLEEINSLNFFKIQNQSICKFICDHVCNKSVDINFFTKSEYDSQDILFTIKQLIENKVIVRTGNVLSKGTEFDRYLKFVFLKK